jgi:hypothetical protein
MDRIRIIEIGRSRSPSPALPLSPCEIGNLINILIINVPRRIQNNLKYYISYFTGGKGEKTGWVEPRSLIRWLTDEVPGRKGGENLVGWDDSRFPIGFIYGLPREILVFLFHGATNIKPLRGFPPFVKGGTQGGSWLFIFSRSPSVPKRPRNSD